MQYYALFLLMLNAFAIVGAENRRDQIATVFHLLLYSPLFLKALGVI